MALSPRAMTSYPLGLLSRHMKSCSRMEYCTISWNTAHKLSTHFKNEFLFLFVINMKWNRKSSLPWTSLHQIYKTNWQIYKMLIGPTSGLVSVQTHSPYSLNTFASLSLYLFCVKEFSYLVLLHGFFFPFHSCLLSFFLVVGIDGWLLWVFSSSWNKNG